MEKGETDEYFASPCDFPYAFSSLDRSNVIELIVDSGNV